MSLPQSRSKVTDEPGGPGTGRRTIDHGATGFSLAIADLIYPNKNSLSLNLQLV